MTLYELKRAHLKKFPNSHWFDQDTLRFFGESISRMRVLQGTATVTDILGEDHTCYIVSAIATKNAFKNCKPHAVHHYFDVKTLDVIVPGREL